MVEFDIEGFKEVLSNPIGRNEVANFIWYNTPVSKSDALNSLNTISQGLLLLLDKYCSTDKECKTCAKIEDIITDWLLAIDEMDTSEQSQQEYVIRDMAYWRGKRKGLWDVAQLFIRERDSSESKEKED